MGAVSKKQRRVAEFQNRKKKKGSRVAILSAIVVVAAAFLVFFFVTLFDYLFPPVGGRDASARRQEKEAVTVYFSDANERFLVPETRHVPMGKTPEDRARELVKTLLDGSKTGLVNTFPDRTELQSLRIEGDLVTVSFGKGLVANHPGGSASEAATVYSLANTLAQGVKGVSRVRILIDRKDASTIRGHLDLREPIPANPELIAQTAGERKG